MRHLANRILSLHCLLWTASILAGADKAGSGVAFRQTADRVEIVIDGQPFTTYYFSGYNKPIFSPLRAASGTVITRGYPMIPDIRGETKDHPHHKGLWLTHGDVNGVDFWSESEKTGRIVHRKFEAAKGGKEAGTLESINDWMMPDGTKVLEEHRRVVIHGRSGLRSVDFEFKLTATADSVKFGDTKEGCFGIRLAEPFSGKSGGQMLNSRGGRGEKEIWGKPAEWVAFTARVNNEVLTVALFDHPKSFRHPTHWHARAYCLFAVNPFGLHDFYNDRAKDGSQTLKKGESLALRYRLMITPGTPQEAGIEGLYKEYAAEK